MLNSFKGFHLCIKQAIMWCPDNQQRKKTQFVHATAGKQKHPLEIRSNKNTKHVWQFKHELLHLYLLRQQIKLLKF